MRRIKKDAVLSIKVERALLDQLRAIAAREDQPVAVMLRRALKQFVRMKEAR
jgi:predicted transcriptional regulator